MDTDLDPRFWITEPYPRILLFTPVAFKMSTKNKCFWGNFSDFLSYVYQSSKIASYFLLGTHKTVEIKFLFFACWRKDPWGQKFTDPDPEHWKKFCYMFIFTKVSFMFGPKRQRIKSLSGGNRISIQIRLVDPDPPEVNKYPQTLGRCSAVAGKVGL